MKKQNKYFYCVVSTLLFLFLLTACANDSSGESGEVTPENDSSLESEDPETNDEEQDETDNDMEEENKESDNEDGDASGNTEEEGSENEEDSILDGYSSEEIEYARVWLQLGQNNEDLNELNVRHIPAGDPINIMDEESAGYPEDVIELRGGRLIDGAVTYSGNGDGTINVYNVPARWETNESVDKEKLQKEYEKVIEETELVEVELGNDEEIKELIDEVMIIH